MTAHKESPMILQSAASRQVKTSPAPVAWPTPSALPAKLGNIPRNTPLPVSKSCVTLTGVLKKVGRPRRQAAALRASPTRIPNGGASRPHQEYRTILLEAPRIGAHSSARFHRAIGGWAPPTMALAGMVHPAKRAPPRSPRKSSLRANPVLICCPWGKDGSDGREREAGSERGRKIFTAGRTR